MEKITKYLRHGYGRKYNLCICCGICVCFITLLIMGGVGYITYELTDYDSEVRNLTDYLFLTIISLFGGIIVLLFIIFFYMILVYIPYIKSIKDQKNLNEYLGDSTEMFVPSWNKQW